MPSRSSYSVKLSPRRLSQLVELGAVLRQASEALKLEPSLSQRVDPGYVYGRGYSAWGHDDDERAAGRVVGGSARGRALSAGLGAGFRSRSEGRGGHEMLGARPSLSLPRASLLGLPQAPLPDRRPRDRSPAPPAAPGAGLRGAGRNAAAPFVESRASRSLPRPAHAPNFSSDNSTADDSFEGPGEGKGPGEGSGAGSGGHFGVGVRGPMSGNMATSRLTPPPPRDWALLSARSAAAAAPPFQPPASTTSEGRSSGGFGTHPSAHSRAMSMPRPATLEPSFERFQPPRPFAPSAAFAQQYRAAQATYEPPYKLPSDLPYEPPAHEPQYRTAAAPRPTAAGPSAGGIRTAPANAWVQQYRRNKSLSQRPAWGVA